MIAPIRKFRSILFAAALAVPCVAGAQNADSVKTATHGDWEVHCIKGTEACAMQQVGKTGDGKRGLFVTIQRVKPTAGQDGRNVSALISAIAPLGVLIPYGLRAKIDGGAETGMPYSRCLQTGCFASSPMSDETVNRMKKGNVAAFSIALDREVTVNISLRGFTAAFNSLKPIAPGANQ